jgi:hypothetical protein
MIQRDVLYSMTEPTVVFVFDATEHEVFDAVSTAIHDAVEMTVAGVLRGAVGETLFDTWDWSLDTIRSEPDPDHPNLNRFLKGVPCAAAL